MTIDVRAGVAVQDLLARYARFIDDRRMEDCLSLFAADAVLEVNGEKYEGRDAIQGWLEQIARNPAGRHLTTNIVVSDVTEVGASAVADLAFLSHNGNGWHLAAVGRYVDEIAVVESRFVFTRRRIEIG